MTDVEIEQMRSELKKSIVDKAKCMIGAYSELVPEVEKAIKDAGLKVDDEEILKRTDMFFHTSMQKTFEEKRETQAADARARQVVKRPAQKVEDNPNFHGKTLTMEEVMALQGQTGEGMKKSPCQERAERDKAIIEQKNKTIEELRKKDD